MISRWRAAAGSHVIICQPPRSPLPSSCFLLIGPLPVSCHQRLRRCWINSRAELLFESLCDCSSSVRVIGVGRPSTSSFPSTWRQTSLFRSVLAWSYANYHYVCVVNTHSWKKGCVFTSGLEEEGHQLALSCNNSDSVFFQLGLPYLIYSPKFW